MVQVERFVLKLCGDMPWENLNRLQEIFPLFRFVFLLKNDGLFMQAPENKSVRTYPSSRVRAESTGRGDFSVVS
jgi:hypothetical protein